ncbi:MAG: AAA family ATPase [Chitinophagaceae bacterium]
MDRQLIERGAFLTALQTAYEQAAAGKGHCVFVSGEAGIGKTSLVKTFAGTVQNTSIVYQGTCDALFTPRPLAPLYDVLLQMGNELPDYNSEMADRTIFFTRVLRELMEQHKACVVVFEDVHWADEATLDFIKFLARRITQLRCLFILTYRDDELHARHPLKHTLGQLNPGSFTRLQLLPLSQQVVAQMAIAKGYEGNDVYAISGGNPFYVNEILASYSVGIPDNIRDSILSVYYRQDEDTRHTWELLSVLPAGIAIDAVKMLEPPHVTAIEQTLETGILILKGDKIAFKHELYRRTIEMELSPFVSVALNKKILDLFRERFEQEQQVEQIIHHAKNAREQELVAQYAPIAAKQAALVGAHSEALKLYLTAIEYIRDKDGEEMIRLYEAYAYECYLTNRISEGIEYMEKVLHGWQQRNRQEAVGNSLRFLSRLWWYAGNGKNAESYGLQAIDVLKDQPSSRAKAMAYSNMSQLKMLSDHHEECMLWGGQAIALAKELNDEETLCHALNNVGTIEMRLPETRAAGLSQLEQSLDIGLRYSYHEHVARAYTNLGSKTLALKLYRISKDYLDKGIQYCEERDLDSWAAYMLSQKARLLLETGHWQDAEAIAVQLLQHENQSSVIKITALIVAATIQCRRGEGIKALPLLLEAKTLSFDAQELQRILPAVAALLEYEWLTGDVVIEPALLQQTIAMMEESDNIIGYNEFTLWLQKVRKQSLPAKAVRHEIAGIDHAAMEMTLWDEAGCGYEKALVLFEGTEEDKRKVLSIMESLGAVAVCEKLKGDMRALGIKSIPRGMRKSTKTNPSLLTDRELDVLNLLHEGLQNKEIAARLFISAKTVDNHITSILFKLDARSRTMAVQQAVKLGIIKAMS